MVSPLMLSFVLAAGATAAPAPATPPAPTPAPAASSPPACTAAEHRQFDFWLGEWEVTRPDTGAVLGHSQVTTIAGGCALHEHWRSARGGDGQSLNAFDRARGTWSQFWTGVDGTVLRLEGGLRGNAMVLEGELPAANGGRQRQRITWTPADDGSVAQHWEVSNDDGQAWTTSFLGIYRRR
ncbi:MAG TPA: hypothetical protein VFQ84_00435 [Arenimonas sp.]|uniref:hypothetical protein n=1 Tax=Arenimonas sp. TaxID=1872635 RepID=UPI002D7F4AA2|nr:hypothetical protein [Arenimonas sp.]HEU0151788.1 hypothetical protein [Arenimonas sp.]